MRIIKKYGNRRLYDTGRSSYINLEELIAIIRAGEEIQVVDARSGEDLTRHVLLQALMESSEAAALFPAGLLHRVIRYSGNDPFQRAVLQQLGVGLELLDTQIKRMERQLGWMRQGVPGGWPGAGTSGASRRGPERERPAGEPPAGEAADPEEAPELDEASGGAAGSGEAPGTAAGSGEAPGTAAGPGAAEADEAAELAALRERLAALEGRLAEGMPRRKK